MIQSLFENAGFQLSSTQWKSLEALAQLVLEKNKLVNLTNFRDPQDLWIKQILNSLFLQKFVDLKPGWKVADLGTGGGFPGLPLALLHPETHFILIDSVQKKIRAVAEFAQALRLPNVEGVAERLEALGQHPHFRESFHLVFAQALAPLPILLELALPLVKVGGMFVAYKGPNYQEELSQAEHAMKLLKVASPDIHSYELPEAMGERHLLVFEKNQKTPSQYPRAIGIPNRKPL